jgi:hypothetical protein
MRERVEICPRLRCSAIRDGDSKSTLREHSPTPGTGPFPNSWEPTRRFTSIAALRDLPGAEEKTQAAGIRDADDPWAARADRTSTSKLLVKCCISRIGSSASEERKKPHAPVEQGVMSASAAHLANQALRSNQLAHWSV